METFSKSHNTQMSGPPEMLLSTATQQPMRIIRHQAGVTPPNQKPPLHSDLHPLQRHFPWPPNPPANPHEKGVSMCI